jgi:hypothetical protein|tara:strand:- start:7 stop:414 length:408 start_codon:yes stop_codon:yes gene_type:complete
MIYLTGVFITIFLYIIYLLDRNKKRLVIICNELRNNDLEDVSDFLKQVSAGNLLKNLPNSSGYFENMYANMLSKKKAQITYKIAIPDYEIAKTLCEKHNFKREANFFKFQIIYYKKYIEWKKNYNKENNITVEFF